MAPRPAARRSWARLAPARSPRAGSAGRWLLVLAALLVVGRLAAAGGPSGEAEGGGSLLDRIAPDLVSPQDPARAGPAGGPRLRSVSTAPARPRLGGAAAGGPAGQAAPVALHRPLLRVDDIGEGAPEAVAADPSVASAAVLGLSALPLADGSVLTVGLVDPSAFRPLSPRVTAEAPAVWDLLERGAVLLSPDQSARLGVRAGGALALADGSILRIAGVASNGAPPVVDVLTARPLDAAPPTSRSLLVAVHPDTDIPALGARLREATGASVGPMPAAEPAVASLVGGDAVTAAAFEPFTYREADGGRIAIDPAWERAHVVRADVPVLGAVRCHRLLVGQLRAALQEVVDAGLDDELDAGDYGGCYVPRHIDWNPSSGLSMHAWGLAVDLNVSTNGLGAPPQLHPDVVEIFEAHGFSWGGRWRRPDGMHFELSRLLAPEELADAR